MTAPLDDLYLTWLYSQASSVKLRRPSRTYWNLFRQLYTKECVWFIPNDDNRLEDGRELRELFLYEQRAEDPPREWLDLGCSFLELLIGLSRRLSFETEREARDWFWEMLQNLGISTYTDASSYSEEEVDDKLDNVLWRTYKHNGEGGLFPLKHAREDQRDVELWYQLSAYILQE